MKFLKIVSVATALVLSFSVNSAIITYEMSGSWYSTNGVDPQELDGALFDFTYTVDSNTVPHYSDDNLAAYYGSAVISITNSPGDIDGVYTQEDMSLLVWTDFNNYGTLDFGNFNGIDINNYGNFILLPAPRITLGIITDTSLPIGDFTDDIRGVWSSGTTGGGSYSGEITHLSSSVVPIPAAVWLFGSGLTGLVGLARRKRT